MRRFAGNAQRRMRAPGPEAAPQLAGELPAEAIQTTSTLVNDCS